MRREDVGDDVARIDYTSLREDCTSSVIGKARFLELQNAVCAYYQQFERVNP
jgi:hypothetical protein